MSRGFYNQLVDIMREHGCWRVDGGKGSHEKWRSPINGRTTTVPTSCKSRHTANAVLKQLGIDEKI
jgi:predicted RNA binding protein YcfA (HicA-like mRNA interferase family)